ncbi:MAG: hypothetical protein NXI04_24335 [Planctomycetaceae bacterium]|nr:hypothetical protein [Planctomycetaceae bacterium]
MLAIANTETQASQARCHAGLRAMKVTPIPSSQGHSTNIRSGSGMPAPAVSAKNDMAPAPQLRRDSSVATDGSADRGGVVLGIASPAGM